jgi:hypothetical protein
MRISTLPLLFNVLLKVYKQRDETKPRDKGTDWKGRNETLYLLRTQLFIQIIL